MLSLWTSSLDQWGKKENCRQIIKRNSALHLVISCSYLIVKIIVYIVVFLRPKLQNSGKVAQRQYPSHPLVWGAAKDEKNTLLMEVLVI